MSGIGLKMFASSNGRIVSRLAFFGGFLQALSTLLLCLALEKIMRLMLPLSRIPSFPLPLLLLLPFSSLSS